MLIEIRVDGYGDVVGQQVILVKIMFIREARLVGRRFIVSKRKGCCVCLARVVRSVGETHVNSHPRHRAKVVVTCSADVSNRIR